MAAAVPAGAAGSSRQDLPAAPKGRAGGGVGQWGAPKKQQHFFFFLMEPSNQFLAAHGEAI